MDEVDDLDDLDEADEFSGADAPVPSERPSKLEEAAVKMARWMSKMGPTRPEIIRDSAACRLATGTLPMSTPETKSGPPVEILGLRTLNERSGLLVLGSPDFANPKMGLFRGRLGWQKRATLDAQNTLCGSWLV